MRYAGRPKRHLVESLLSPFKKPPPEYLYLNQKEKERERKKKYEVVAAKSGQLGRRRKSRG